VARGKHGTERRQHDVEAAVAEREVLGVALLPLARSAGDSMAAAIVRSSSAGALADS
jgi:hypothetical protein